MKTESKSLSARDFCAAFQTLSDTPVIGTTRTILASVTVKLGGIASPEKRIPIDAIPLDCTFTNLGWQVTSPITIAEESEILKSYRKETKTREFSSLEKTQCVRSSNISTERADEASRSILNELLEARAKYLYYVFSDKCRSQRPGVFSSITSWEEIAADQSNPNGDHWLYGCWMKIAEASLVLIDPVTPGPKTGYIGGEET